MGIRQSDFCCNKVTSHSVEKRGPRGQDGGSERGGGSTPGAFLSYNRILLKVT